MKPYYHDESNLNIVNSQTVVSVAWLITKAM